MGPGVAPFQGALPKARPSSLLPPHLQEWKLFRFWLRKPVSSQGNIVSPRRGGLGPGIPRCGETRPSEPFGEGPRPETHTDGNRNRDREAGEPSGDPQEPVLGSRPSSVCTSLREGATNSLLKEPILSPRRC